jgi:hypothetical protein
VGLSKPREFGISFTIALEHKTSNRSWNGYL